MLRQMLSSQDKKCGILTEESEYVALSNCSLSSFIVSGNPGRELPSAARTVTEHIPC